MSLHRAARQQGLPAKYKLLYSLRSLSNKKGYIHTDHEVPITSDCQSRHFKPKVEARGKKKKIALFVFFADLVIKKIFVLKLIYAFVFWVVIHKAGYFLTWFARYLKEQKKECHDHDHYVPHYYDGPHHHDSPQYGYGPYRKKSDGFR